MESFGSMTSCGGAGGKGPDFGGIGEDGKDEGVEEAAHEGWCGEAKLGAAKVKTPCDKGTITREGNTWRGDMNQERKEG